MYSFIEEVANNHANIKVIGIGGGGCNAVERMLTKQMNSVEFIACNTDMQSLQQYHAPTCLQLGSNLTRGLGAGGNPKVGRAAAMEDDEMIRSHLTGADMVFVTAGMGGGTGTGGAPIVAQIARELEILTIAVVTLPFRFEGRRRQKIAEAGIRDLEDYVDTLIVIPNEKLLAAVEPDTTVRDAFTKADEILSNAVQGISDLITEPGQVNVDFADVRTIMTDQGKAILGTGFAQGEDRAVQAVQAAISSPLLDNMSINGARGILLNITSGEDLGMMEMNQACESIYEAADEDALIIFGHVINPAYSGQMKITVIATGFEAPKVKDPIRSPFPRIGQTTPSPEPETEAVPAVSEQDSQDSNTLATNQESTYQPKYEKYQETENSESNQHETYLEPDSEPISERLPVLEPDIEADTETESATDHCEYEQERQHDYQPQDQPEFLSTGHLQMAVTEIEPEPALNQPGILPGGLPEEPALEPVSSSSINENFPSVPDYSKRDLGSGAYKRDVNLSKSSQRIFYGDINTPAFLRRKAD